MYADRCLNLKYKPGVPLFLVFMFIFVSDDTVLFGTNANSLLINCKYIYICAMAIVLFGYSFLMSPRLHKRVTYVFLVMSALILISMIANNDIRLGYFYKIILMVYAIGLIRILGFDVFRDMFTKIIYVLALISICFFLLYVIAPGVFHYFPKVTNSAGKVFYNAFLYVHPAWENAGLRNYGLFREPGVYQMYLIIALMFTLSNEEIIDIKKVFVLILAVITTVSTTGYIALAVVIIIYLRNRTNVTKNQKYMIIFAGAVGIIYLLLFTDLFSFDKEHQYTSVFYKLTDIKAWSTIARFASVTENIRIMLTKPFFGVGLDELDRLFPIFALENYGYASPHNSNTFMIQFAAHGFLYGSLYLWCYTCFAKRICYKEKDWLLYFLVLAILYVGENLTFSGFSSFMLISGLYDYGHSISEREENEYCGH